MGLHKVTKAVTVYKAAYVSNNDNKIGKALVHLRLPVGAEFYMDKYHNEKNAMLGCKKCRATKAKVLKITRLNGKVEIKKAYSFNDLSFLYKKGDIVKPVWPFCREEITCASGIHFFFSKKDAKEFGRAW